MKKQIKTNVMRVLDAAKIEYTGHEYLETGAVNGMDVANALGEDPKRAFKTLVTQGHSKAYYVFMIPVCDELDLKKAAKCAGEKKIEMIKAKELLPLTGYVHGGCSPIGMKKTFPTFIDKSAENYDKIMFSGGKIGFQVEVAVADLSKVVKYELADLTVAETKHFL